MADYGAGWTRLYAVFGVMLESNLVAGRQDSPGVFGQSITDACIGIEETGRVLAELATSAVDRA